LLSCIDRQSGWTNNVQSESTVNTDTQMPMQAQCAKWPAGNRLCVSDMRCRRQRHKVYWVIFQP